MATTLTPILSAFWDDPKSKGSRSHGRTRPAATKAYRASPAASTHQPTTGAAATLRIKIRKASTSPSKRPPKAETVPVRRATRPSTASSSSAGTVSMRIAGVTSLPISRCAVRPATAQAISPRARVTRSAGPRCG